MEETLVVTSERVDDIPVLVAHMARMDLQRLVDEQFRVHGNWQGLSLGWVTVLWLSHILSEADHRLNTFRSGPRNVWRRCAAVVGRQCARWT